ncbi:chitin synthase-domain-containing protein [Suillus bovinus]|uniref:chitin synthase-domain-containing protein n=1 Tax=Suillus bovinus TaxID=48563 RepID=UPI001B87D0B9|nr:chitin synthase-domain-containing protein [Suillus bovinus]KAG2159198.1 chitin synthase-domain-containing protein [Suillus bovinus]
MDAAKSTSKHLKISFLCAVTKKASLRTRLAGKDVTAHIFEYTSNVVVTETGEVSTGNCPVQIILCLKEQIKKKLNSHCWFFNTFGPLINPNVCVLLDVGTKPTSTSVYELWKCFNKHSNVGGACGEICVDTGRACLLLLTSPLAASQKFRGNTVAALASRIDIDFDIVGQYIMSYILDKPLESVFGYISVLPGAFSAYRYRALPNGPNDKGPLASYFKGEAMHGCLRYVKSAKAATDVPTTVPEFISQRRQWLNGSLFASFHSTIFFYRIWTSGQNPFVCLYSSPAHIHVDVTCELLPGFSGSSATTTTDGAFNFLSQGAGQDIFQVFLKLFIALLFVVTICSLGNQPQGSKWIYSLCMVLFCICNIITLWCAGWTVYLAVPHTIAGWKDFPQYMVIVKVGKPTARSKPGNRGKCDSQILLMHYLNRVHFNTPMNVIGIDPVFYKYIFTIDADTQLTPESLNRLVMSDADDSSIIGICGKTKLTNEEGSWRTMIQVYKYYISHHLLKAFKSLFGSVSCLPGCFSLYHIRTADKGRPIIISNRIIGNYLNMQDLRDDSDKKVVLNQLFFSSGIFMLRQSLPQMQQTLPPHSLAALHRRQFMGHSLVPVSLFYFVVS